MHYFKTIRAISCFSLVTFAANAVEDMPVQKPTPATHAAAPGKIPAKINPNIDKFGCLLLSPETQLKYLGYHATLGALAYSVLSDFGTCSNTNETSWCQSSVYQITKCSAICIAILVADGYFLYLAQNNKI